MSKSAAAKKLAPIKKTAAKAQGKTKPQLKMVKSNAKPMKAKSAKKAMLKEVKKAMTKAKVTKAPAKSKAVAKNVGKKQLVAKSARVVVKKSGVKLVAKTTKVATKITKKPISAKAAPKIVARPISHAKKQPAKAMKPAQAKPTQPVSSAKKTVAQVVIRHTAKPIAKPLSVGGAQARPTAAYYAAKAMNATTSADGKMLARPISVSNNGFNKIPRSNGFVKKSYRVVDMKAPRAEFKIGSYVVYPTHGVGQIIDEETQEIGGTRITMFVISFVKDKMTLRVPLQRAHAAGLRHISSNTEMKKMFETLKAKARTSRGMWSRRAQEYESKINSGNVLLIAEVVRDLHQNVDQAERSYSERMIYESAFGRLAGELAASEKTEVKIASDKLLKLLRAKQRTAVAA